MATVAAIRTAITNALASNGTPLGADEFHDSISLKLWSEAKEARFVPVLSLKARPAPGRLAETQVPEVAERLAVVANALHALDPNLRMRPIGHHDEALGQTPSGTDEVDPLHNWSPINLDHDEIEARTNIAESNIVYVSFQNISYRTALPRFELLGPDPTAADPIPTVRAFCGDSMKSIVERAHAVTTGPNGKGYTLPILPAPNVLSLGGVMAIGGHGSRLSFNEAERLPGGGHREWPGSISASAEACTAIVWDASANAGAGAYVARRFFRNDEELAFLTTHLGRIIVVDYTLRVMPDYCLGIDFTKKELKHLFGADDSHPDSVNKIAERAGFEVLAFRTSALTDDRAHVMEWTYSDKDPTGRWKSDHPLDDIISGGDPLSDLMTIIPWWGLAPIVHNRLDAVVDSLEQTKQTDPDALPSPAADQRMYAHSDAMPLEASGWSMIIPRRDLQEAAASVYHLAVDMLKPTRMPLDGFAHRHLVFECRAANLDDVGMPTGGVIPDISMARPYPGRSGIAADPQDAHIVLWFSVLYLTRPHTMRAAGPYLQRFEKEVRDLCARQSPDWILRPEWAKGWGYTDDGGWKRDAADLQSWFETVWPGDRDTVGNWRHACKMTWQLDPHGLFTSAFHDKLLPNI